MCQVGANDLLTFFAFPSLPRLIVVIFEYRQIRSSTHHVGNSALFTSVSL